MALHVGKRLYIIKLSLSSCIGPRILLLWLYLTMYVGSRIEVNVTEFDVILERETIYSLTSILY
jgi:hypothetical protein